MSSGKFFYKRGLANLLKLKLLQAATCQRTRRWQATASDRGHMDVTQKEKSHSPVSSASFNRHLWPSLFKESIKAISPTIGLFLAIISLLITGFGWRNFLQIILIFIKKFQSATILTASVLKFHLTIIHQETEKKLVFLSLEKMCSLIWYYSKCN